MLELDSQIVVATHGPAPNDCLLHDFEKKVEEQYENLGNHEQARYYIWFRVSNGGIINLTVQAGKESCGRILSRTNIC